MRAQFLAWFGFITAVAFFVGGLDAQFTARWALMAVVPPTYFLLFRPKVDVLVVVGACLVAAAVALPALWAPDHLTAWQEAINIGILLGCTILGAAAGRELGGVWRGLAAGVAVSSVVAAAQLAGWQGIPQAIAPAGLFINKNLLAEAGAVALVAMTARREWLLAVPALAAVLMGNSRGAFGALVVVIAFRVARSSPRTAAAILCALAVAAGFTLALAGSGMERLVFWGNAVAGFTPFGNGLGSWPTNFPYAEFAHSEPLQYLYEIGIFAAVPAAAMLALLGGPQLERTYESEGMVLVLVLALGVFSFPFHMPITSLALALSAGALARDWIDLRRLQLLGRIAHGAGAVGSPAAGP